MNSTRENIMSRIRRNLTAVDYATIEREKSLQQSNPESYEMLHKQFNDALEKVGGRVVRCTKKELPVILSQIFSKTDRVCVESTPYLHDISYEGFSLEGEPVQSEGGITTCDALIAETGTVILSGGENKKKVLSLITRTHCVIARPEQYVSTLEEYFARLQKSDVDWTHKTSSLTFITGTSRTADIEKILIKGMHGPRELIVVLVGG